MTDIALITTTIHVPHVLRRYRELGPDVEIIVAGDTTTDPGCETLCHEIGARYLSYGEQERLYPGLSDMIGPRSIQRRNFATLEAIRSGADIVVTVDDDNWPADDLYFVRMAVSLTEPWTSSVVDSADGWFNPGDLALREPYHYRGLPFTARNHDRVWDTRWDRVRIGVFNGLVLGDPDVNATERIERSPHVEHYDVSDEDGEIAIYAINPRETWAPINSQNTAYVRELTPLMGLPPGIGRYDDIWGSYVAQAVMRATDYHVAYGPPFVRQERNPHNLIADLKAELYGMEYTEAFTQTLREIGSVEGASVVNELADVAGILGGDGRWSHIGRFYDVWLDAVSEVL